LKGLSPVLATIMLIALTLVVIGLVGSWFTSMTKRQTEIIETGAMKQINCTSALFDIVDVICSNSSQQLKIAINNIGQTDLYGFSAFVKINNTFYQNSTGGPNSTSPLGPGKQTTLVYGCGPEYCSGGVNVGKIRLSPSNCPQVYIEEDFDVTCG